MGGNIFSSGNVLSAIALYPHEAGKTFPAISNAFGSNLIGNMIPESMIDGRKMMMETIEVFAWPFTAQPISPVG